ncbi:MAG: imelysin family protein [Kofleriaceae bacterium]
MQWVPDVAMRAVAHRTLLGGLALTCALSGCAEKTDLEFRTELVSSIHASIDEDLASLVVATRNIQAAAPSHAWAAGDAAAIEDMRGGWKRMRAAFERVEGAISPLFLELDEEIDGRYDTYLAKLGTTGDPHPFDDTGVIGMHAVERILYAPVMRSEVLDFESALPGYRVAAFPASDADAIAFKSQLVERLVEDVTDLQARWNPSAVELGAAYDGLVGLMTEQQAKLDLAATGEEESRYANVTLFDLRNNLDGTQKIYDLFRGWIQSKPSGEDDDDQILHELRGLEAAYTTAADGDALPLAPPGWAVDHPSDADLATPFGVLWQRVHDSVDPAIPGSVVGRMNHVAELLGFPELTAP